MESLQVILTPLQADQLSSGTAVRVTGTWQSSPEGTKQSHELHATNVDVLGTHQSQSYPLQKKYHTVEYLRTIPHLRTRTPFNSLLLRLRSQAIAHLTNFFDQRAFVQTHPPIITSSDCEGAGEAFTALAEPVLLTQGDTAPEHPFFRSPKYLTVSSQLHLEALAQSVGKVWTLSPTFRAERSDTARHLSEFYMLEAELSFVDQLEEIMCLVQDMLQSLVRSLEASDLGTELMHAKRGGESGYDQQLSEGVLPLRERWHGLLQRSWPRISYTQAIGRLQDAVRSNEISFVHAPQWGSGLQLEHERYLASVIGRGVPTFVTDYPRASKAFYMSPSTSPDECPAPGPTAACFDLLVPDLCEIAGGSMREHRLQELLQSMKAHGLANEPASSPHGDPSGDDKGSLDWYLDLRRYGSVPHGGFGLGFDRLLAYLAGVPNIREVVAFPRWYGRCEC
ncbi:MAG: asparaginyl-tRNA synthetase [Caeruleum heppii]|nr:MAG: asparaginyl-tRNA synthetase [Caeruleum heppii]